MSTPADTAAVPLAGSGTVVRVVTDGSPWPGVIVREDDGRTTLHVDAAVLRDTAVWCAAVDGHLLAPVDVVRTATGQEAVFPLCQQRLDDLLRDRFEAGAPPSPGECVTVAVSVLRGTEEAAGCAGQWWLTDEGRPVLALGGDTTVADAAGAILALLVGAAHGQLARALAAAGEALDDPRGELSGAEDALFAAAEPAPLVATALGPARARTVATALRVESTAPRSSLRAAVARHVDADVADRVLGARDELRERWAARRVRRAERRRARRVDPRTAPATPSPARSRSRRAPLVAGVVVAAAVLGVGLLWPSGDPSSAGSSATPSASAEPDVTAPAVAASTAAADPPSPEDPAAIADVLLTAASACPDETCLAALRETPGRPAIDGVLGLPTAQRAVVLVDDYGGVAVLRVSAATAGTASDRLLVIVETGRKWLIRDAYDVADQP